MTDRPGDALVPAARPSEAGLRRARYEEIDRRLSRGLQEAAEARRLHRESGARTRAILGDLRVLIDERLHDCGGHGDAVAYLQAAQGLGHAQAAKYARVAQLSTPHMMRRCDSIEVGAVLCRELDGSEPMPAVVRDLLLDAQLRHRLGVKRLLELWHEVAARLRGEDAAALASPEALEEVVEAARQRLQPATLPRRSAAQVGELGRDIEALLTLRQDPGHGREAAAVLGRLAALAARALAAPAASTEDAAAVGTPTPPADGGPRGAGGGERRRVPRQAVDLPAAGGPGAETDLREAAGAGADVPAAGGPGAETGLREAAGAGADVPAAGGPGAARDPGAAPPARWAAVQVDLPVAYPAGDRDVTEAERRGGALIVALAVCAEAVGELRALAGAQGGEVALDLGQRALREAAAVRQALRALGERLARAGFTLAPGPGPVPLDGPQDLHAPPMAWVSYEAADPFDDPAPSALERALWPVLGLCAYLGRAVPLFEERADAGEPCAHDLLGQLAAGIDACAGELALLCALLHGLLRRNEGLLAQMAAAEAQAEAARRQAEERLIVLGEPARPPQYTVIGLCDDGRPVALSQDSPQLVLALGAQGTGKTHLSMLLLDGVVCPQPGLGPMPAPPRLIRIGADWQQGASGGELRAGFSPNGSAAQWEALRRDFGVARSGRAIRGATLLCLPESVGKFRDKLADLCERGLQVEPLRLHPGELGQSGYGLLLGGGEGGRRPAYRALVESIIAWHGEDATPALLLRELGKVHIDGRARGALELQLRHLERIVSPEHHVVDQLERGWPLLVYLESRALGQEQILPLEVALMNALSRPLRSGADPHRWMLLDELNTHLSSDGIEPFLLEAGAQLRHRPVSLYLSGQRARDIPSGLAGLATVVAQFNTGSVVEFRRAQELFGVFSGVSYEEVRALRDGEALIGAVRATERALTERARRVRLRPSTLHTGGETLRAV